jgi:predicted nucleic-acid-binding protein
VIGLDTDVLVRYFAQDEPRQAAAARRLFQARLTREAPGHVNVVTLAETCWVLSRLYAAGRGELVQVIENLLAAPNIVVERRAQVRKALQAFDASPTAGFSDCLIAQMNGDAGCQRTLTFDRGAAKIAGFELLA